MKRRQLLRHLTRQGCHLLREGSDHSWWLNPATGARSSIPRHVEINDYLVRKILRDLGVPSP